MRLFYIKKNLLKTTYYFLGIKTTVKNKLEKQACLNNQRKLLDLAQKYGAQTIKVGFLVSEPSKWQYESIYQAFEDNPYFEPVVLITELAMVHKGHKSLFKTIDECYNFFKNKGLRIRYAYDKEAKRYLTSPELDVDILFYQQPWELDDSQHPAATGANALGCYISYGCNLMEEPYYRYNFHNLLWKIFLEHESLLTREKRLKNLYFAGFSKLDAYHSLQRNTNRAKKVIIYAPHHSFEKNGLRCATFCQTGQAVLKLAQETQDFIHWIFKPHPRFKQALQRNGILTEEEIAAYYAAWEQIGEIYEGGDYFERFVNSDGLITDCVAFLAEYLPSKQPVFHLKSPYAKFNDFAHLFIDSYYQCSTAESLKETFERVIINQDDYKKEERLSKIKLLYDETESSGEKIVRLIEEDLKSAKQPQ